MVDAASRVEGALVRARQGGTGALLPYFTAGYPSLESTVEFLRRADRCGVAGVELGFPYSDSIADGPTITSSYQDALGAGLRVAEIFAAVRAARDDFSFPLSAMVSFSIVDRVGVASFAGRAAEAGFDAMIVPDLSLEEAPDVAEAVRRAGLDLVMLVAPTSSPQRRELICRLAGGFLYYVSVAGTTGVRDRLPEDLADNVRELRAHTSLPICVGFGVGSAAQVREVCAVADGAIVGSAIIRRIAACIERGLSEAETADDLEALISELMQGTR
jgi:tryptophan synthase alpha chain